MINWQTAVDRAWKTRKYEMGMTQLEIGVLLDVLKISPELFWDKFGINTSSIENNEPVFYLIDIERTVRLIKEKREMRVEEWD